jgi:hypothetical protein
VNASSIDDTTLHLLQDIAAKADAIEAGADHHRPALRESLGLLRRHLSGEPIDLSQRAARPSAGPARGVYVASRTKHAPMWRAMKASGRPILSTWIRAGDAPDMPDLWARVAREIPRAERLVLFISPLDSPLRGAFVEVGMALAAGVPVFVAAGDAPEILLGSWIHHPLVTRCATLDEAFTGVAS